MTGRAETLSRPGIFRWLSRPATGAELTPDRGSLRIVTADQLLMEGERPALRRRIDRLLSVPRPHLETLFHSAIKRYACFVQQFPASEAHHHASTGGMLDHGLEVVANALALRRGHLLPHGDEPERLARSQDLWTYAVFTAALLHDIGKPAVDQRVTLFDARGRALGTWDPWQGPMDNQARSYRVTFVRERSRGLHERVAPLLARLVVPAAGLSWLASDQEVLAAWVATLCGDRDHSGTLGEIVSKADRESVARNLGAGDNVRLPTVQAVPLHEKLLTALRHLVAEGELPLNRNGAAGWLFEDELWLVSKRAADALRAHLLAEGHTGIPSSNDRIFDVLQEHGLVVPNGERAIWRARVAGESWSHELTLLRIAAARVWPDPQSRPEAFAGSVTTSEYHSDPANSAVSREQTESLTADTAVSTNGMVPADGEDQAVGLHNRDVSESPVSETNVGSDNDAVTDSSDSGRRFLDWLRAAVADQRIQVNTVNARIHVVPEGVLLVSPGIFKDFAAQHPEEDWSHVQKRFQKLKVHRKTDTGTNIHRYQVAGGRKRSAINGLLLPDATLVFGAASPPQPNPHLSPKE
ncbi:MAG: MobH family relaxase [Gammaproteobacteria bacterium]|nr:MobH family relaxase [Gammaproteobacteria bacterium]